jgi:hypothetical protein
MAALLPTDIKQLEEHLATRSYIEGYVSSLPAHVAFFSLPHHTTFHSISSSTR